jgi:hypothetical protein
MKTASGYRHESVPTEFVENGGIRYAYRRFGKPGTPPLLGMRNFEVRWKP